MEEERRQGNGEVLAAVRDLDSRVEKQLNDLGGKIDTVNVRLFGTTDGTEGEGRLVIAERTLRDNKTELEEKDEELGERVTKIENLRWQITGACAVLVLLVHYIFDFVLAAHK